MSDFEHDSVQLAADESVDMVNHPPHYRPLDGVDFECIELARRLTFDAGNAVKYMWRTDMKNGRQDVEKARWYVIDARTNADRVYVDLRLSARFETKLMLRTVAKAQKVVARQQFFDAIADERFDLALIALDALLRDAP